MRPWEKTVDLMKSILEIGPLANPTFKKENANVFYADIRDTQAVKDFYKGDGHVKNEAIVDIDYVIKETYSKSITDGKKFDYIVMSHVIEHIPELIKFFEDVKNILKPNGKLCLAIPDHRFCFDHFRQPTSFAEVYDIYTNGIKNVPFRVLDFSLSATINDKMYWWCNFDSFEHLPKSKEQFERAKKNYFRALNGDYVDVHFSVFTPETFLLLLYNMLNFNLNPFKCVEFYNTDINSFEFNCVLEYEPNLLVENSSEQNREAKNLIELLANTKRDMLEKELYAYDKIRIPKIENRTIYLWGIGEFAGRILSLVKTKGYEVSAFLDKQSMQEYHGYKVEQPEIILSRENKDFFIFIASTKYAKEMAEICENYGLLRGVDFWMPFLQT